MASNGSCTGMRRHLEPCTSDEVCSLIAWEKLWGDGAFGGEEKFGRGGEASGLNSGVASGRHWYDYGKTVQNVAEPPFCHNCRLVSTSLDRQICNVRCFTLESATQTS